MLSIEGTDNIKSQEDFDVLFESILWKRKHKCTVPYGKGKRNVILKIKKRTGKPTHVIVHCRTCLKNKDLTDHGDQH